ncbi:MAG: hypothetical protein KDK90_26590, partial [Leptospiraceae bacterium]|nr:hypothetical protein [Leptospiraceae bacterium]
GYEHHQLYAEKDADIRGNTWSYPEASDRMKAYLNYILINEDIDISDKWEYLLLYYPAGYLP